MSEEGTHLTWWVPQAGAASPRVYVLFSGRFNWLIVHYSPRIATLKPSLTVALNTRATQLAKAGAPIINLTVGEPDFPTPAPVVEAGIDALRRGMTKYRPAGGSEPLRDAIRAKLARENQFDYPSDQIVAGIGAKEILFHTFMAILGDGDEVIVPAPYWVSYPEQIRAMGGKPVEVPPPSGAQATAGATLDIAGIARAGTSKTVAIVLNSPNNPAGYVTKRAELEALAEVLLRQNWWIISDEIYEYLAFDAPHVSLLTVAPDLRERFILVNGMSKSYAMTGWRVGYAAAPVPLAKLLRGLQSHSSTCLPGFVEEAAICALNHGRPLVEKQLEGLRLRRDLAVELFSQIQNVKILRPEGAFYVFFDVREALAQSSRWTTSLAFCEHLLETHHVATVPGEAFGAPGFVRLSYATSDANLRAGVAGIRAAVADCCSV